MLFYALNAALPSFPTRRSSDLDRAGVVTNAKALDDKLAQFERDTSDQILVYVRSEERRVGKVGGFRREAVHKRGDGKKGRENGGILFVVIAELTARSEYGRGLE